MSDKLGIKHEELTEQIIGIFYAVYNELGQGFLESVYECAMEIALREAGLRVRRQESVKVWFRRQLVGDFRADLVVEEKVLLELKAVKALDPRHDAQGLNYLRATELEVALVLNFGPRPQFRRLVFDNNRKRIQRVEDSEGSEVVGRK